MFAACIAFSPTRNCEQRFTSFKYVVPLSAAFSFWCSMNDASLCDLSKRAPGDKSNQLKVT